MRKIFLLTIVSYSLIFAALLAAGSSFLYRNYVTTIMEEEVRLLNAEIATFEVSKLGVISDYDLTLKRATDRLDHTASILSLLNEIESATAEPVFIESFAVTRLGDSFLEVNAKVVTQSFDSAIFQRALLEDNEDIFGSFEITDVTASTPVVEDLTILTGEEELPQVTFSLVAQVPIEAVPYSLELQSQDRDDTPEQLNDTSL